MANYRKFFTRASEEGLEALELSITKTSNFSFGLFRNEIDSYEISDSFVLNARGIYQGKTGYASCEKADEDAVNYVISHIKENAELSTSADESIIFAGSEKYHKKNVYNKKLAETGKAEKIAFVKKLDAGIKETNPLIAEVETAYRETSEEFILMNSHGLNLKSRTNYAFIYSSAVAADESGDTKNGFNMEILTDLDKLDRDAFVRKVVEKTISQFGSAPCKSARYRCVLSPAAVSSLLAGYVSNLSSAQVQKKSSLLEGKLNQQVASRKLTVYEKPLMPNAFFRYFDDEGVATCDKTLIKNGVLNTYLYNLRTAGKDGVASTGNGYKKGGNSIDIGLVNVCVKPGKLTEKELIEKCGNGIYIDDLSGIHAGLNPQSGNFSLLSSGFLIENGKLTRPVALITSAGNIFDVFNNVQAVGNNVETQMNTYQVPSMLVKSIMISGE